MYCNKSEGPKGLKFGVRMQRPRPAFTLIELLVVLAIIATLAAVVAPEIFRNVGDARIDAAKAQIESLGLALDSYHLDNGSYPSTEQGLAALASLPNAGTRPVNWRGPYLKRAVPADPWGRPYAYTLPLDTGDAQYELYSLGRDGRAGGQSEDQDITASGRPVRP